MNGKGLMIALGVFLILGLSVAGLFLVGALGEGDGQDQLTGPLPDHDQVSPHATQESQVLEKIQTRRFDASASGEAEAAVSDQTTGFQVWGMVEDPGGQPLAGATVDLVRDVSVLNTRAQEDAQPSGSMLTRTSGTFRFRNVEPGERYVLRVSHESFATERVHPIEVARPRSMSNVIVRLKGGLSLAGTIADESGQPLPGARVSVYDLNVQVVDPESQVEKVATADANGHYQADHLTPGTKKVVARLKGYAADGQAAVNLRSEKDGQAVNIVLMRGLTISGVVLDRDSRTPVEGALITARPVRFLPRRNPGQRDPRSQQASVQRGGTPDGAGGRPRYVPPLGNITRKTFLIENTRSDKDGNFVVSNLFAATYMLMVRRQGYQANTTLRRNAGSENVEVLIAPSARVQGRVVDDVTGRPVARFAVAVTANPNLSQIPPKVRQRFEDPEGRFTYHDVSPGGMYIFALAEGYAGGRFGPVSVSVGQDVDDVVVRMVKGATLQGRITDSGGKAVSGATIRLRAGPTGDNPQAQLFMSFLQRQMRQSSKTAVTGADGRWRLPHVMSGTYTLRVSHKDYSEGEAANVSCGDSGIVDVPDLVLTPGGIIKGIVRTKAGEPDARASVMITGNDPSLMFNWTGTTDVRGEFECRGLKPGTYRVVVHQREGQLQIFQIFANTKNPQNVVSVAEGQVRTLEL